MVEVRIIKDCNSGKKGEIINYNEKAAANIVSIGYAEYVTYNTKKIQYYKNSKDNKGEEVDLKKVLDKIKTGFVKVHTDKLRSMKDKKERGNYKREFLPAVAFAGTFEKRNKESLKESSGLVCLDYDESYNSEESARIRALLEKDTYVRIIFKSPSGALKYVVETPKFKSDYQFKQSYFALKDYYNNLGVVLDESGKDICRLCFLSDDENIYINEKSKVFTGKVTLEEKTNIKKGASNPKQEKVNTENKIPTECKLIEEFLAKKEYKSSGGFTKHAYVDPHVYNYCLKNNKKGLLFDYMQLTGREVSAFNKAINVDFNCGSLKNYCKGIGSKDELSNCSSCSVQKEYIRSKKAYFINDNEEIYLPGCDKLITEFAEEISNKIRNNKDIFVKKDSGKIVKIDNIDDEETNRIGFKDVTAAQFISYIEKSFKPGNLTFSQKKEDYIFVKKSLSKSASEIILESDQFKLNMPLIRTIYTVPIPILHDGKLTFPKKGYDDRFKSWLDHNSPLIKQDISLEDAKQIINELFKEFCFKEEKDKTHAIAGLLTPFLRGLYPQYYCRAPIFLYEANRERSGKDYCAGITGLVYEGEAREEPALSTDDNKKTATGDELRKKLLSSLKQGRKRLHFANNRGFIQNAILEGFATSKFHTDRVLGKSEEIGFGNDTELSMSANIGLTYTADLMYRMRKIRLFLEIEDPNDRKFINPNLHKDVLENRSEILGALYTIVKDWVDKGSKKGVTAFSSFPEWAEICGGIMVNVGFGDPCLQDEENSIGGDTLTHDFKILFEIMHENFPNMWLSKQDVNRFIQENKADYEIFGYLDLDTKSDQIKFGKALTKMYGRIFSDIRLDVDTTSERSARHKIKFFKESGNVGNVGNNIDPLTIKDTEPNKKTRVERCLGNTTNITNITTSTIKEFIDTNKKGMFVEDIYKNFEAESNTQKQEEINEILVKNSKIGAFVEISPSKWVVM